MAKNRNQNPNRRAEQPQRGPAVDAQEQGRSHQAEEHMMPAATQVSRNKQGKRFGHN